MEKYIITAKTTNKFSECETIYAAFLEDYNATVWIKDLNESKRFNSLKETIDFIIKHKRSLTYGDVDINTIKIIKINIIENNVYEKYIKEF